MKKLFISAVLSFSIFALAADPGVSDSEVVFGAHTSESGNFAIYSGNPRGAQAYFDFINEKGGIHGRKIKFIRIDTQGVQAKTVQAAKKLVEEDKIFAMVASMGASHQVIYQYLIEKGVPDMFFSDALKEYGEPFKRLLFPAYGNYEAEGAGWAETAVEKFKGKKACFLISDNTMGEEYYQGIKTALENGNKKLSAKEKLQIGSVQKVDRIAVNPNAAVSALKRDSCEVVFNSVWGPLAGSAINYALLQDFKPAWFVLPQNTNDKFIELLSEGARNGIFSSTFYASPADKDLDGYKLYEELMKKNNIPASKISISGYVAAQLTEEVLKRAGKNLNRETFLKAAESLKNYKCSMCAVPVTFTEKDHWGFKNPLKLKTENGKWVKF